MLFLLNRSNSKNLSSSLFSISGSTFTKRTKLLSRNSCIFVPACGMRRFTMAGMTKKTVQQATPTTNSNSNTSTVQNSTNVQNSTVSSPMSNSNSNVSSSMSNSSYTVPSPMSSSSSTTSSSSSSSLIGSVANYVANITHPNNYLHNSNPSKNNFTTSQVYPQPLNTVNCGDSGDRELSFNLPTLATFTGEQKPRDSWVSQIFLGYQGHTVGFNIARMLTHASGRFDENGEWQYHQQIALTDVNRLSRIQFLTELRIRIQLNNPEFVYKNFSSKSDPVIYNDTYKASKDSLKMFIVLLQDPVRFHSLMTTNVIDKSMTATEFKILYQIAKQNDPNLFS